MGVRAVTLGGGLQEVQEVEQRPFDFPSRLQSLAADGKKRKRLSNALVSCRHRSVRSILAPTLGQLCGEIALRSLWRRNHFRLRSDLVRRGGRRCHQMRWRRLRRRLWTEHRHELRLERRELRLERGYPFRALPDLALCPLFRAYSLIEKQHLGGRW